MNKLIRFYNQNRHMVWVVILSIAAVIALIQLLDNFAYEQNIAKQNNSTTNKSNINYNYSVITEKEVKSNVAEIIEAFLENCNNGQVEEAYKMLSDECKAILYPSIEDFKEKYYNKIFSEKKSYIYQAWITQNDTYTYRIDFTEDMLATGKPAKTSIIDYYTIVKNNNENKLNINKFVGIEDINKEITKNNILINVKRKKIFMDYEIYDIKVLNNTQDTILLDDMKSTDNIYVEDDNEEKYFWYNNEVIESDIKIKRGYEQELSIKINKGYNTSNKTKKIVFENIVLDNKSIKISIEI